MNVSYQWLKELVDIPCSLEEYERRMVLSGFEIEGTSPLAPGIEKVVVGKLTKIEKHPDADKLQICTVDVGDDQPVTIVTGADNVFEGAVVPVAMIGAHLPDGTKIKKGKLRGVESWGMLCGGSELGFDQLGVPGAEVDGILILKGKYKLGQDIVSALGLDDTILEFSITSNRSDCMSQVGLAMESAAVLNTKCKVEHPKLVKGKGNCGLTVQVEDKDLCPRYMAAVVDQISIEPSPEWMQRRLIASGIRPINNIVDITNYVMLEYGQPMHAFDYGCLDGDEIIVRRAGKNKDFVTLDGKERKLSPDMLMIADRNKPVGIAGVMGGENSQITRKTKKIVLESALFDSKSVRHTAKELGLMTDAAAKYSKGISPMNSEYALNRALELIQELKAGTVLDVHIDVLNCDLSEEIIKVSADQINQLTALELSAEEMAEILERLQISTKVKGKKLTCTIPSFRLDMHEMADVAEEVARIHGYHHIPSLPLTGVAAGSLGETKQHEAKLRGILTGKGFHEVVTYSFGAESVFDKLNLDEMNMRRNAIRIKNPLGEDQSIMRTVMADAVLTVLSTNKRRNIDALKIFELGRVYWPLTGEKLPNERRRLALGMYGDDVDFYGIKGIVEGILAYYGVQDNQVLVKGGEYLHPGRRCVIEKDGDFLAEIGEFSAGVLSKYDLSCRAYYGDLDLINLEKHANWLKIYRPIPKYPAVFRDLAAVMPEDAQVGYMMKAIQQQKYVDEVKVFDVYQGKQVGKGKKSVAFSIVFRADDRTLTEQEINKAFDKIVELLEREFSASLR